MIFAAVDWLVETSGRLLSQLNGWKPVGQRVWIQATDGPEGLEGTRTLGAIVATRGGEFDIALDVPEQFAAVLRAAGIASSATLPRTVRASPRYRYHSVFRVMVATGVFNVCDAEAPRNSTPPFFIALVGRLRRPRNQSIE